MSWGKEADGNERVGEIDTAWLPIREDLSRGHGRPVADSLAHFREVDRGMWVALRARVEGWMIGYLLRVPVSDEEMDFFGGDRMAVGRDRMQRFFRETYLDRQNPDIWSSEDLPYILQEMSKHVRRQMDGSAVSGRAGAA